MAEALTLPGMPADPAPVTVSLQRRRTLRAAAMLADGKHPANGLPINRDHRCGDCFHIRANPRNTRTFFKCLHHRFGCSHSDASDMRLSWPACPKFEARP